MYYHKEQYPHSQGEIYVDKVIKGMEQFYLVKEAIYYARRG